MDKIKTFPRDKKMIREAITQRNHYLAIVYAVGAIAIFQQVYTWMTYTYVKETNDHLIGVYQSFLFPLHIVMQLINMCFILGSLYALTRALMTILTIIYACTVPLKLLEIIVTVKPLMRDCENTDYLQCLTLYDRNVLIHNLMIAFSSSVLSILCLCAAYHHTPLVVIKMKNDEANTLRKLVRKISRDYQSCGTSISSKKSSKSVHEVVNSGDEFIASIKNERSTKAFITDKADVVTVTSGSIIEGGVLKSPGEKTVSYSRPYVTESERQTVILKNRK